METPLTVEQDSAPAAPLRPCLPHAILDTRVLAILRGFPPTHVAQLADAVTTAGICALEVTIDSPQALESIAMLRTRLDSTVSVGAGTITSVDAAARCIDAGAQFLVSPNVDPAVIVRVSTLGVPMLAGALSPTEALRAWDAGASAVKLFPAASLGPGYLRSIREPLGEISFVPTGGVGADNAQSWLEAGAVALAVGSWLIREADPSMVRTRAERLLTVLAQ